MMKERTLRVLEYNKIIEKLEGFAAGAIAKNRIKELVPSSDCSKVEQELTDTTFGTALLLRKGNPPLGGTRDMRLAAERAGKGAILTPVELMNIGDVLRGIRYLKTYAKDENQHPSRNMDVDHNTHNKNVFTGNTVCNLINCLHPNKGLEEKISHAIIGENEISDNASPLLLKIRRQITDLQNSVKDKLNALLRSSKNQKLMQDSLVTMRGDRYVIPVKSEYKNEFPGIVHDMSSSGATIFIEPIVVVETNNEIKKAVIREEQEIERILIELSSFVAEISEELISDILILGNIDFIFAKAKMSLEMDAVCPKVSVSGKINIIKGRHPLIDKQKVVPINIWLGEEFSVLVVTGPNTGGKTVTLKTVGLLTLMAQAGLHIPAAERSEIKIFENIFADIGDEQSIEQSLSTFSSHMKNIVEITKEVEHRSLVLFDELGAGTDPTEGAALAIAILEHVRKRGAFSIATTHYSELKLYAISNEGVENACCEFSVETLQPTYKLLIGIPGKSNAFAISSRLGLSQYIIDSANRHLSEENIKFEDLLSDLEEDRSRAEEDREAAERYKKEAERLKLSLDEEKEKIVKQRENLKNDAAKEAARIIKDAKDKADEVLANLKRIEIETGVAVEKKEAEEMRQNLKKEENKFESIQAQNVFSRKPGKKPVRELKAGDTVKIISLGQKGTVITPPPKGTDGDAVIQAGIMKINIHPSNLELIEEKKTMTSKGSYGTGVKTSSKNISSQLDLRGTDLDEAISILDKYIDDAAITGMPSVVIVHGKGTGVLRNGIQAFLKKDKRIEKYRLGTFGEGENGVTIATLTE